MSKFLQKTEETNPFTFMRRMTEELNRAFGLEIQHPGAVRVLPTNVVAGDRSARARQQVRTPCRPARLEEGEREDRSHPRRADD